LIDINMGFGAAQDKATGNGIEGDYTLANGANFGGSCAINTSDPTCAKTSALNGFMMGFGANLMLWQHFGVGLEVTLQPNKPTYAAIPSESLGGVLEQPALDFLSRTTFYDFNGIYQPWKSEKAELQLIGGFGGASVKTYESQTVSGSLLGSSSSSTQLAGSSTHLNLHGGVAFQYYLTDHFYIRPQFDIHYVPNLAQFGSKLVTQEMVWVGYTIGDRK
jgi:hypothetical protein